MAFFLTFTNYFKMNKIIYEILDLIEKNNFEAYIVGGYVRDKILAIDSKDIDIITNATPKDLFNIFKGNIKLKEEYGAVKIIIDEYRIDITTYRKDLNYENNKPTSVLYINNVEEDLKRRDFTINTLLMNKEGKIIDLNNSINDISERKIKVVGDTSERLKEDTTRILRAIRFMVTLDFNLDEEIIDFIVHNKKLLGTISYYKKKEELSKIFTSHNLKTFVKFIKKYKLEKYLGIKVNNIVKTPNIIGVWAQIKINNSYPFTNNEKKQINLIKYLVKKKTITNYDIYKYGVYICSNASIILKKSPNKISKLYNSLTIKNKSEINISAKEICDLLNIKVGPKVGEIYNYLEKNIINNKINNNKDDIIKFIKKKEKIK